MVGCGRLLGRCDDKPGDNVGNFLVGHGLAGNIAAPVRRVEVRPAGDDDSAQTLVADQAEIGGIGDRTCLAVRLCRPLP